MGLLVPLSPVRAAGAVSAPGEPRHVPEIVKYFIPQGLVEMEGDGYFV